MKSLQAVKDEEEDGMECCAQWALLLFNIPLLLIGIALIVVGGWTISDRSYIADALQTQNGGLFNAVVVFVVIIGVFITIVALAGCIAVVVESRTVLIVYYISVLVMFLCLIIAVVMGFTYRAKVADKLRDELAGTARFDYDPNRPSDPVTKAWDQAQKSFKCCGVGDQTTNPWKIWFENKKVNSGTADSRVPRSCCLLKNEAGDETTDCNNGNTGVDENLIYKADCFDQIAGTLRGHVEMIGILCIIFAILLIAAAAVAICYYFLVDDL